MSFKNWKITAHLSAPMAGDAPYLDALLMNELACKMGMNASSKLTRATPLRGVKMPPIPVAKRTVEGIDLYCISDPILVAHAEYVERQAGRFETDLMTALVKPKELKKMTVTGGHYKSRYAPVRVRNVGKVVWFARCDRGRTLQLLRKAEAIGAERSYGYGRVHEWTFEEVAENISLFAKDEDGNCVVMRTMPVECAVNATGYKATFGAASPPYWHPDNFREIAKPC